MRRAKNDAVCPTCKGPRAVVDPGWLREQREAAGLTVSALAIQLGFSIGHLARVELGERPLPLEHPIALAYKELQGANEKAE